MFLKIEQVENLIITTMSLIYRNVPNGKHPAYSQCIPTIYVLSRNMKNIRFFLFENFQFLEVKFSMYLNRRIFVMCIINSECIYIYYIS